MRFIDRYASPRLAAFVVFIMALAASLFMHRGDLINYVIWYDAEAYYQYLPAVFINGNIEHMVWAAPLENGNTLNLCQMGVAVLQLPFFLIAHFIAKIGGLTADGYSPVYAYSILIASCVYGALGVYLLGKVLQQWFSTTASFITVLFVYLGTNLFFYFSFEAGMSHIYSFFLFAWFIYYTPKFFQNPSIKRALIYGFIIAMIGLVRPNNLVIGLYAVLYGVTSWASFKERLSFLFRHPVAIGAIVLVFVLLFIPQLLYWQATTGSYLVFTYGEKGQGFNWGSPELWNVLFSHQNGWLIYSPIMVISLIGLAVGVIKKQANFLAVLLIWLLAWYLFASWWSWWFGGAYGHRAFVEYYAFLAIPFAYIMHKVPRNFKGYLVLGACLFMAFINVRMCFNYVHPWNGPEWTWDSYLHILKQAILIF